ncbi:MAG: hypothetical protein HKN26_15810 [Acidimicrobiales bacterium]|nr:hypothetical protein [Acidimicrobiales bacterium]
MKKNMTAAFLTIAIAVASNVGFASAASADPPEGEHDCVSSYFEDRRSGIGGFVRDLEPGGISWGDIIQVYQAPC